MKYKRIIFISLLFSLIGLMCFFVFAEKEVLPIITWDRTFGGRDDDGAESLIQTTDSGYVVAGETSSKGAGEKDLWVIKLDHQGDMIWDRTYGGINNDWANSLIQTTNGGYAVAGLTGSKGAGKSDFWVIKLDSQGDMIWDRTFRGSDIDGAYSLIQTTDGGYTVAGWTSSKGAGKLDFWVIKLDHQGNTIWDRTYGGNGYDWAESLIQTTDGGYVVAGFTSSKGAGGYDFWVIKLDVQGKSSEEIDTQNTGAINLTSTPSGAKVFSEAGQFMGRTPLTIDKVSPGKHKVTLVLVDYEKYVQEVDVIAGKVVDVSATLVATRIQPTSRIWSLEGRFIDFSSICEFHDREPKLLSPQLVKLSAKKLTVTDCSILYEKLLPQQPLAIIIKIQNTTNVTRLLTLPLTDLIVHTQTDSKPALAFYCPWHSLGKRGWASKAIGCVLEVELRSGTAMELLYLIPRFNGKAKIELLNIGSFEINEPK